MPNLRHCLLLLLLPASATFAAPACDFSRPVPKDWATLHTWFVSFRAPPAFRLKQLDGIDTIIHRITGDGVAVTTYYGISARTTSDGETPVRLGGLPALLSGDDKEIAVRWPAPVPGMDLVVAAEYSSEKQRRLACDILASARLLGTVDDLAVLRTRVGGRTGTARLRVRGNYERTFAVGDFTTLWWGKLRAIDADSITIDETVPDGKGGWQSRTTRLPMQGKPTPVAPATDAAPGRRQDSGCRPRETAHGRASSCEQTNLAGRQMQKGNS